MQKKIKSQKNRNIVFDTLVSTVVLPQRPSVLDWASRSVFFDTGIDANSHFIIEKSPYAKFVFDCWLDPRVEEIYLLWPTQSGKTVTMITLLCYIIANDPGPIMVVQPDEKPCTAFVRFRLKPTIRKTFPGMLSNSLRDSEWTDNYGAFIGGAHIWPAWSTSESRCRSWSRRYIIGDETSIWRLNRRFMLERSKQFERNRKAIWGTTPTTEDDSSWDDAVNVFQLHRWCVTCPHCKKEQVLEFSRLQFTHCKKNDKWDYDAVERETFYECEHCKQAITERQRVQMLLAGRAITQYSDRDSRLKSLRITCLDVPGIPWGSSARTFLECQGNTENLKTFVNGWLCEPWRAVGEGLRSSSVLERRYEMRPGIMPEDTKCLLAGIDVQLNHIYVVVRAFLNDGRSICVYANKFDGKSVAEALAVGLNTIIFREWEWDRHDEKLKIIKAAIDCAFATNEIYRVASMYPAVVQAVRGYAIEAFERAHRKDSIVKEYTDYRSLPGVSFLVQHVPTGWYRMQVLAAYKRAMSEEGAWLVAPEIPNEYGEQLESWQIHRVRLKTGKVLTKWSARKNDHYLDCECYILALFEYLQERQSRQVGSSGAPKISRKILPRFSAQITKGDASIG